MGRKTKEELQREAQTYHINTSGITLRQFKLALVEHNLLTDVESTIKHVPANANREAIRGFYSNK